ncbi:MAG: hypothetical protein IH950_15195 [Bacteroidetes bacterium]|nr:hypothetical protein [Bacteroidota bacterium]
MTNIDVEKLTSCNSDWEMNQYTLLSRVKEWESHFRKNRLHPYIKDSIELHYKLADILQENLESKWWLEREVGQRVDDERIIVYEKAQQVSEQLNQLLSFVEWALRINRPIMEEGLILKEFIEDNLTIKPISSEPNFRGKGYFSLTDNKKMVFNIYLYDLKWGWTDDEPEHTLNIKLVRSIPLTIVDSSEEELMRDFIEYSQPLYKPVAYIFKNELDFPYAETIYPVAEEKLLTTIMT